MAESTLMADRRLCDPLLLKEDDGVDVLRGKSDGLVLVIVVVDGKVSQLAILPPRLRQ